MNTIKPTIKPKVLIAYHADCIDGFTAAWVTAQAMEKEGRDYELLAMDYNEESLELLAASLSAVRYSPLYIVDYSVPVDFLTMLSDLHPLMPVIILDHHKTAFEMYVPGMEITPDARWISEERNITILLDNNHSGAAMAWRHFNTAEPMPKLVAYVEDYDLWRFNLGEQTKWVNKLLMQEDKVIANWSHLADIFDDQNLCYQAVNKGFKLQETHNGRVSAVAEKADRVSICGISGLAVACPRELASDVGHKLALLSGTFGAMFIVDVAGNRVNWSLRSNGDFDVSALAKKYGGGGHKNAGGFETKLFSEVPSIPESGESE